MTVSTWTSNDSDSWRTVYDSWRGGRDVYQGEWSGYGVHRGLWFFNDASIRSVLAGQTISKIRLKATRHSKGGYSSAQTPGIWHHNYSSKPAGKPGLSGGHSNHGVSWAWGDTKWVTLPLYYANYLRDGVARGIAIYSSSGAPYMIFSGTAVLEITHEPTVVAPATPPNFRATIIEQTTIRLDWDLVSNADDYNVDHEGGSNWWRTGRPFDITGLAAGTTHRWRILARNSAGNSAYSAWITTLQKPPTPVTPATGTVTTTSVAQSVTAVAGASRYYWYRNGTYITYTTGASYTFTGLSPDTSYDFQVRAWNSSGYSGFSPIRTAKTLLPVPAVPTGLAIASITETSFTASWNAVSYAATYTLRVRKLSDNTTQTITGITTTSHSPTVADGEDYEITVEAVNASGVSGPSAAVPATTPRIWALPLAPTAVGPSAAVVVGTSQPTLTASVTAHPDGLLQKVRWHLSRNSDFSTAYVILTTVSEFASGTVTVVVPSSVALSQGRWYVRAHLLDSEGGEGPWAT